MERKLPPEQTMPQQFLQSLPQLAQQPWQQLPGQLDWQQQWQQQIHQWQQQRLFIQIQQNIHPSPPVFLVDLYQKAVASAVTIKDDRILEGFESRQVKPPKCHDARRISNEDWEMFDRWLGFHRSMTVSPTVPYIDLNRIILSLHPSMQASNYRILFHNLLLREETRVVRWPCQASLEFCEESYTRDAKVLLDSHSLHPDALSALTPNGLIELESNGYKWSGTVTRVGGPDVELEITDYDGSLASLLGVDQSVYLIIPRSKMDVESYRIQHAAIDAVDFSRLFPTTADIQRDSKDKTLSSQEQLESLYDRSNSLHGDLSPEQKIVVASIEHPRLVRIPTLVEGPFGSGKSHTLFQALTRLLSNKTTRVLISTHTNSAADAYVRAFAHGNWPSEQVFRLLYSRRNVSSDSQVERYTRRNHKTELYVTPTKEKLLQTRVIICTNITAGALLLNGLDRGFFTHIFIDEAAMAGETELLVPLSVAGPRTKLCFVGDHRQMRPFDEFPDGLFVRPLLGRLSYLEVYHDSEAKWCRGLFSRVFRCHPDIVAALSHFYGDRLVPAKKDWPAIFQTNTPKRVFHRSVENGKEEMVNNAPTNQQEVIAVAEVVEGLLQRMLRKNPNDICVISPNTQQTKAIRTELRKRDLSGVNVHNIDNVQGLEFEVVVISTVRTLNTNSSPDDFVGPLAGNRVNTALSRARAALIIVGHTSRLFQEQIWEPVIRKSMPWGEDFECVLQEDIDALKQVLEVAPNALTKLLSREVLPNTTFADTMALFRSSYQDFSNASATLLQELQRIHNAIQSHMQTLHVAEFTPVALPVIPCPDVPMPPKQQPKKSPQPQQTQPQKQPAQPPQQKQSQQQTQPVQEQKTPQQKQSQQKQPAAKTTAKATKAQPLKLPQPKPIEAKKAESFAKIMLEQDEERKRQEARQPQPRAAPRPKTQTWATFEQPAPRAQVDAVEQKRQRLEEFKQEIVAPSQPRAQAPVKALQSVFQTNHHPHGELLDWDDALARLERNSNLRRGTLKVTNPQCGLASYLIPLQPTTEKDVLIFKTEDLRNRSLHGDEVVVELLSESKKQALERVGFDVGEPDQSLGRVVAHKPRERTLQWLCFWDSDVESNNMFVPLDPRCPRVAAKGAGGQIFDEKSLYLIQFTRWKEKAASPEGVIVGDPLVLTSETCGDMIRFGLEQFKLQYSLAAASSLREKDIASSFRQISTSEMKERSEHFAKFGVGNKQPPVITIDPFGSQDLDDAVSVCRGLDGSLIVGVHIADVGSSILPDSKVDMVAQQQISTVYFPDGSAPLPMFPNDCALAPCSLLADGKPKRTISMLANFKEDGQQIGDFKFFTTQTVIARNLSYEEAQNVIEQKKLLPRRKSFSNRTSCSWGGCPEPAVWQCPTCESEFCANCAPTKCLSCDKTPASNPNDEEIEKAVLLLHQLSQKLRQRRKATDKPFVVSRVKQKMKCLGVQGAEEAKGEKRYTLQIEAETEDDSHSLIEELMILYNQQVAQILREDPLFICRAQRTPDEVKLQTFWEFVRQELAVGQGVIKPCLSPDFNSDSYKRPDLDALVRAVDVPQTSSEASRQALRHLVSEEFPLETAGYALNRTGNPFFHYALGISGYTHATSPIRRYVDVLVQRRLLRSITTPENLAWKIPDQNELMELLARINMRTSALRVYERDVGRWCAAAILRFQPQVFLGIVRRLVVPEKDESGVLELFVPDLPFIRESELCVALPALNCDIEEENVGEQHGPPALHISFPARRLMRGNSNQLKRILRPFSQVPVLVGGFTGQTAPFRHSGFSVLWVGLPDRGGPPRRVTILSRKDTDASTATATATAAATTTATTSTDDSEETDEIGGVCLLHKNFPLLCFSENIPPAQDNKQAPARFASAQEYSEYWTSSLLAEAAVHAVAEPPLAFPRCHVLWNKGCKSAVVLLSGQTPVTLEDFVCIRRVTTNQVWIFHGRVQCRNEREDCVVLQVISTSKHLCRGPLPRAAKSENTYTAELVRKEDLMESALFMVEFMPVPLPCRFNVRAVRLATCPYPVGCLVGLPRTTSPTASPDEDDVAQVSMFAPRLKERLLDKLDEYQKEALERSMGPQAKSFLVVQGVPGSGKTTMGCAMLMYFARANFLLSTKLNALQPVQTDENKRPVKFHIKSLFTGPSNQAVNVMTDRLIEKNREVQQYEAEAKAGTGRTAFDPAVFGVEEDDDLLPGMQGLAPVKLVRVFGRRMEEDLCENYRIFCGLRRGLAAVGNAPNYGERDRSSLLIRSREASADEDALSQGQSKDAVSREVLEHSLHTLVRSPGHCSVAPNLLMLEAQVSQFQKDFQSADEEVIRNLVEAVGQYFKYLKRGCAEVIEQSDVILCTCTTSGSPHVREVLENCHIKQVMVDEAAQALEPEALVPASLVADWGGPVGRSIVILLGDHKQLGPVVMCTDPGVQQVLSCSLMDRLSSREMTDQWTVLLKQYRMHPKIAKFASTNFYGNKIIDGVLPGERDLTLRFPDLWPPKDKTPLRFVDCRFPEITGSDISRKQRGVPRSVHQFAKLALKQHPTSFCNTHEVERIIKDVKRLIQSTNGVPPESLFIVTPYKAQELLLYLRLREEIDDQLMGRIKLGSVHSGQGAERDLVLFSCVRGLVGAERYHDELKGSPRLWKWLRQHLGHTANERLLNVAMTRARHGIIVYGCRPLLELHANWEDLIKQSSREP